MMLSQEQLAAGVSAGEIEAVRNLVTRLHRLEKATQIAEQAGFQSGFRVAVAAVTVILAVTFWIFFQNPRQRSSSGSGAKTPEVGLRPEAVIDKCMPASAPGKGKSVSDALKDGNTLPDIKAMGLVVGLKVAGVLPREAKAVGYTASEMMIGGYSCTDVREAGFAELQEAKAVGYNLAEMCAAGYSCPAARAAGYSLSQIKAAGYVEGLKAAGYSCSEAKAAGYSCSEATAAVYSIKEMKAAGYSSSEAKAAGYSLRDWY